jgi:hypothetical protein
MPHVGFDAPNAKRGKVTRFLAASRFLERASLDRVTQCRARTVRLKVGQPLLTCLFASDSEQRLLCTTIWRCEAGTLAVLPHS